MAYAWREERERERAIVCVYLKYELCFLASGKEGRKEKERRKKGG